MTIHISIDTGCNLGCEYCYEEPDRVQQGNHIRNEYDLDKIFARLDQFREKYDEIPGLHGGEPLLIPHDDLDKIFAYITEHWDGSPHIQTNGTLIDDEHVDLFLKYDVDVGISCDGPGELNSLRQARGEMEDGSPTDITDTMTERTTENIARCSEAGCQVGLIVVLTEQNAGTDERLEILLDWMDTLAESGITGHYNPAIPYEDIQTDESLSPERLKEVYLRTYEWMKEESYRVWNPMAGYKDNLLGAQLTNCVNNKCDSHNAGAAKIITGDGDTTGCGKTWSAVGDGVPFLQGDSNGSEYGEGEERYQMLKQLPGWVTENAPDMGGCKGCRYWNVCYDDETEVLTGDGWKYFEDVTMDDSIATLNQDTHSVEYHKPTAIQTPDYDGDLIHWSGDTYDLRVTPDHNVFARSSPGQRFENHRASEIEENSAISFKRGGSWDGESMETFTPKPAVLADGAITATPEPSNRTFDADDWFEFLGWYLAEGSSQRKPNGNHRVSICQRAETHRREIESLLERMGFNVYMGEKDIQFDSKQIVDHIERFGTSEKKYVPDYVKDASTDLIRTFLTAYAKGDGTMRDDRTPRIIYTNSEHMADDLQELGMKADWPSTKGVDERVEKGDFTANGPVYYTTFAPSKSEVQVWTDSERESYDGTVYDLTVPNHTMYVRRNGKALWSGNCQGGCPSSGLDGDYRKRTRVCQAKYATYEAIEQDMRTTFPNIRLITDLPWDAEVSDRASRWNLDIQPFAAIRPGTPGRSSASLGATHNEGPIERSIPDELLPDRDFEQVKADFREEYPEEHLVFDENENYAHADSEMPKAERVDDDD